MSTGLRKTGRWIVGRSENFSALLMAGMILSFLYQIVARYVFNSSAPWAEELCVIAWVWGILWCSALVVRPEDDIRIDLVTVSVSPLTRRVLEGLSSLILIAIFLIGMPGAWSYVTFMKIETTPALGWRFNWVFSVYILFACAVIVRQSWSLWQAIKGEGNQRFNEGREAAEL